MNQSTEHPLNDFVASPASHLQRLQQTGNFEMLIDEGREVGVVMSPAAYRQLLAEATQTQDVDAIRDAHDEHHRGEALPADAAFDQVRSHLDRLRKSS